MRHVVLANNDHSGLAKRDTITVRNLIFLSVGHLNNEWDSFANRRLYLISRHVPFFPKMVVIQSVGKSDSKCKLCGVRIVFVERPAATSASAGTHEKVHAQSQPDRLQSQATAQNDHPPNPRPRLLARPMSGICSGPHDTPQFRYVVIIIDCIHGFELAAHTRVRIQRPNIGQIIQTVRLSSGAAVRSSALVRPLI
jgi:hypothetical protein